MTVCVPVLAAALVGAGGLRVDTATPAALCPDIDEVRRAVHDRLTIEGEGEWLASVDLVHRPRGEAGDVVRVELRDPEGRRRLQRELPRSGESWVALAQAVALVLESYFRHPNDQPLDLGRSPSHGDGLRWRVELTTRIADGSQFNTMRHNVGSWTPFARPQNDFLAFDQASAGTLDLLYVVSTDTPGVVRYQTRDVAVWGSVVNLSDLIGSARVANNVGVSSSLGF